MLLSEFYLKNESGAVFVRAGPLVSLRQDGERYVIHARRTGIQNGEAAPTEKHSRSGNRNLLTSLCGLRSSIPTTNNNDHSVKIRRRK